MQRQSSSKLGYFQIAMLGLLLITVVKRSRELVCLDNKVLIYELFDYPDGFYNREKSRVK